MRSNPDDSGSPADPPDHIEQLESFIDVNNTALVLAECDGDKLLLLLWNLPSNRPANAGRYVSTNLLLSWHYKKDDVDKLSLLGARAATASWLDPQTHERFLYLVDNCIEDADPDESGEGPAYRLTESFRVTLSNLIEEAVEKIEDTRHPSDLSSEVRLDSVEERKRLAQTLMEYNLPLHRSTAGSCVPLVIVTRNKLPVEDVWQMLTALPSNPTDVEPGKSSYERSFKWPSFLKGETAIFSTAEVKQIAGAIKRRLGSSKPQTGG